LKFEQGKADLWLTREDSLTKINNKLDRGDELEENGVLNTSAT